MTELPDELKEYKDEMMKFIKNMNSEAEERKAEIDKYHSSQMAVPLINKQMPRYKAELYLTGEQWIQVYTLLKDIDKEAIY